MELWIRSQNKTQLVKVDEVHIYINIIGCEVIDYKILSKDYLLGSYATEERALEVLDEIQDLIKPIMLFQNCECDNDTLKAIKEIGAAMVNNDARVEQINLTVFYQMPEN